MKGKFFETLVRLIQESLKDSKHTEIYQNYKIPTSKGRLREFDIVIKTVTNNYPICIVIECKDHNRKIAAEKVEAFHSKCMRVAGISKKIMVSKIGFQKEAFDAAKDFDISLFQFDDLNVQIVKDWISELGIKKVAIEVGGSHIQLILKEPCVKKFNTETEIQSDKYVEMKVKLKTLAMDIIKLRYPEMQNFVMQKYNELINKHGSIEAIDVSVYFPFGDAKCFILFENHKYYIDAIGTTYEFKFSEKELVPDSAKVYKEIVNDDKNIQLMTFSDKTSDSRMTVIKDSQNANHTKIIFTNVEGKGMKAEEIPSIIVPEGLNLTIKKP